MRTYTASGVVLRRIDLGEKDRILTVYTREHGKLSAIAKGSRRPGSKLSGASEPFAYSRMMLAAGRDLEVLAQADIKESFPNIKTDMRSVAHAVYFLELVDRFSEDRQPNPDLFDTLLSSLYVLESRTDPELAARHFELQVLTILGYEPHFDACLKCGRTIGRERIAFSPSLGGIVCNECGMAPNDAIWVPGAAASYVSALRRTQPNLVKDLKMPPGARHDVARMLKWHIRYRLERDLKSIDFIQAIEMLD
jgi:DNA repair protein RecO (recombination protein O)